MSNKQIRIVSRLIHIVAGSLLAAFVYSATLRTMPEFIMIMQFVVLPIVIGSGVALWQQPRLTKWLRGGSRASSS